MGKFSRYQKKYKYMYMKSALAAGILLWVIHPIFGDLHTGESRFYEVTINGEEVGSVDNPEDVDRAVVEARRKLAAENDSLVFLEIDCQVSPVKKAFGLVDGIHAVSEQAYEVLKKQAALSKEKAYTVKVNEFTVNLKSKDDVLKLLAAAKNKYDKKREFNVELVSDPERELNVFTTSISKAEKSANEIQRVMAAPLNAGIGTVIDEMDYAFVDESTAPVLENVSFEENIEVVEAYVADSQITQLQEAVDMVTKDKETNKIYEVESGDCLSVIAQKTETTVDEIVAINENLENENSVIQVGDELVVTVPEPEISVVSREQVAYNEDYEAEVQYIDNDSWYTTDQVTRQEGTVGNRDVVALVTYRNDRETDREILEQTVYTESLPTIIERGTKTPPTYIKPLSGGSFTSGFKWRWGRQHKGVDWACPVGTAIKASSSGTVASAGWASGYGYCVRINHPDGRQTRYAHLSKILVKTGQKVKQGDKIALSGNTGNSTGPHVHFEILINGSQVNPLNYLN